MTVAVDIWAEQSHFRHNAIEGSARLRDAIFALLSPAKPIAWVAPKKPRRSKNRPVTARKAGRPPNLFAINPEIERIKQVVADHYEIERFWMECHSNSHSVSRPRMVAMFLARTHVGASYPNIGKHFNRDHTTVLWAHRAVMARPKLERDAQAILQKLLVANDIKPSLANPGVYRVEDAA